MNEFEHTVDVGAADPELNTSPIADEGDEETEIYARKYPANLFVISIAKVLPQAPISKVGHPY